MHERDFTKEFLGITAWCSVFYAIIIITSSSLASQRSAASATAAAICLVSATPALNCIVQQRHVPMFSCRHNVIALTYVYVCLSVCHAYLCSNPGLPPTAQGGLSRKHCCPSHNLHCPQVGESLQYSVKWKVSFRQ